MSFTSEKQVKTFKEIEEVITKAIKKVGGRKENDLCKYLPVETGGYMHHFTLRKMRKKQPTELTDLIDRYIIKPEKPSVVKPKNRAARGSRKRKDQITFTKLQLERLLNIARLAGDKEMISVLSPKKSIATYKRELIQSIRNGSADQELWNGYIEAVNAHETAMTQLSHLLNPLQELVKK